MSHVDKKILGFDMDGVVIDNGDLKIQIAKHFGINLVIKETHAEIVKQVIPKNVFDEFVRYAYNNSGAAILASVMDGFVGTIKEIKAKKIPYYLITRRHSSNVAIK